MPENVVYAENLNALPHIRHAFFTRPWGVPFFRGPKHAEAEEGRRRMAAHLGARRLVLCDQVHSTRVVVADSSWPLSGPPEADAMVSTEPDIAVGILTADCVPVLFASSESPVIGAAHAGWRGALGGVIESTVAAVEKHGVKRESICAALGPCLWQASYEVGPEFPAPFLAQDPANARFFKDGVRESHYQFDLKGYVESLVAATGIKSIAPSFADTCANPDRFFSHRWSTLRGERREGNLVSAIVLRRT